MADKLMSFLQLTFSGAVEQSTIDCIHTQLSNKDPETTVDVRGDNEDPRMERVAARNSVAFFIEKNKEIVEKYINEQPFETDLNKNFELGWLLFRYKTMFRRGPIVDFIKIFISSTTMRVQVGYLPYFMADLVGVLHFQPHKVPFHSITDFLKAAFPKSFTSLHIEIYNNQKKEELKDEIRKIASEQRHSERPMKTRRWAETDDGFGASFEKRDDFFGDDLPVIEVDGGLVF